MRCSLFFAAPNSAKDRDFRQQKTALKDTATADNELPAALQEILLDSKPLDNTASDQATSDNLYFSKCRMMVTYRILSY